MSLSRKDFLRRTGSLALPLSFAGASLGGEKTGAQSDLRYFDVRKFGAQGDGRTKDTKALQEAMDEAGRSGGTVYLPPGRYLSGTIRFKSHVTIFLDAGTTLIFSPDRGDFDPYEKLSDEIPCSVECEAADSGEIPDTNDRSGGMQTIAAVQCSVRAICLILRLRADRQANENQHCQEDRFCEAHTSTLLSQIVLKAARGSDTIDP